MPKKKRTITTEDALRMLKNMNANGGGSGGAVASVNGKTGKVVLSAEDVGALPNTTLIPTRLSELENDKHFLTPEDIGDLSSTQADWMQNDILSTSYINNRTHWSEVEAGEEVYFAQLEFEEGMCGINAHLNFKIGDTYMVSIGSFDEVTCVASEYVEDGVALGVQLSMMNGDEMIVIVEFYDDFAEMMGVPVMVVSTYNGSYSLYVCKTLETVHKLPSKYLNMSDIVQAVIVALKGESDAVFGVVDDANNITISGSLESGTYTLKYENADGTTTEIGTFTLGEGEIATYTNLFNPATASINTRYSNSSGTINNSATGYVLTDYIPVTIPSGSEKKLYIKGASLKTANSTVLYFISSKQFNQLTNAGTMGVGVGTANGWSNVYTDENGNEYIKLGYCNATQNDSSSEIFDANLTDTAYIRVQFQLSSGSITADDIKDIIITIDEPITD